MINIYKSELLLKAGFKNHGFTSGLNFRFDSKDKEETVKENLASLKNQIKTELPLAWLKQVHGNKIIEAKTIIEQKSNDWTTDAQIEGDAIISNENIAILAVKTADCVPVLLADPESKIIAIIHAGWQGTAKGIIRDTVKKMKIMGATPASIIATTGPCICLKCYEVGEEVARHFPESSDPIKRKPGKYLLDISLAVEVSLIAEGLTTKNIQKIDECTYCNNDLFSHRQDTNGQNKVKSGRQLAFIGFS